MYSILNQIDKNLKEKGRPFKNIVISSDYFPKFFNYAILQRMRKANSDKDVRFVPSEYVISYDKNDHIYLLAVDKDNRINFIVSATDEKIDPGFVYTGVTEKSLTEDACMYEYLQGKREEIKKTIKQRCLGFSEELKIQLEAMKKIVAYKYAEIKSLGVNITSMVNYVPEYKASVNNINGYMNYLNEVFLSTLQNGQMSGIRYNEPATDTVVRKTIPGNGCGYKERINPTIAMEDRLQILDSYPSLYRDYAYTYSNKQIDYMNYLFRLGKDKYVLIMEPYSGMKYTKIVVIDSSEFITRSRFNALVKTYLQLSGSELLALGSTSRKCHTSMETFTDNIGNALLGEKYKTRTRRI